MTLVSVEIIRGKDVFKTISDEKLLRSWIDLAIGQKERYTLFQEKDFVSSWYKLYDDVFEPLLFLGRDNTGEFIGVLPLAYHHIKKYLTHAGNEHAEYHGWVASDKVHEEFLAACFKELKGLNIVSEWTWNFMPKGLKFTDSLLQRLRKIGIHIILEKKESLIWDLTKPEKLRKMEKIPSVRSKINRYKSRGNYRLERLTDPKEIEKLIKSCISWQVDLRKEALNNTSPFSSDPHKSDFYSELSRYKDSSHVTVLWLDDNPIASHFGHISKNILLLGLSAFDPAESRNSPGTLLIYELAKMVTCEGYKTIDLTPGGDYKVRYANSSQILYKPTVYFSRITYVKGITNRLICNCIKFLLFKCLKMSPAYYRTKKSILIRKIRNISVKIKLRRILFQELVHPKPALYNVNKSHLPIESKANLKINNTVQLMSYTGKNQPFTRETLFCNALRHYSRGALLITEFGDNNLKSFAWLYPARFMKEISIDPQIKEQALVLTSFYNCDKDLKTSEMLIDYLSYVKKNLINSEEEELFILFDKYHSVAKQLAKYKILRRS